MELKEIKARLFDIGEEKEKVEFEIGFFVRKIEEVASELATANSTELKEKATKLHSFAYSLERLAERLLELEQEEKALRRFLK